jgi:hypothetical protein
MDSQRLLRLSGLATRLNLPAYWLNAEAKAGRLPCLRVGRHMLFNGDAVERALAARAGDIDALCSQATHGLKSGMQAPRPTATPPEAPTGPEGQP